jgi:hypothetical protein
MLHVGCVPDWLLHEFDEHFSCGMWAAGGSLNYNKNKPLQV